MNTRSGATKLYDGSSQAPDSEPAKLRRSSRPRKSAKHLLDSSDEEDAGPSSSSDGATKPSAQRQLTMPTVNQVCLGQVAFRCMALNIYSRMLNVYLEAI